MTFHPAKPRSARVTASAGDALPAIDAQASVVAGASRKQRRAAKAAAKATVTEKTRFAAFVELTKPRITVLLLITCIAGMLCAARGLPDLTQLVVTALGLAMSSGGASALNHVIDRDIDRKMVRTAQRPVATGLVSVAEGTAFGIGLMAAAGIMLWVVVNPLTAILALTGGLFYVTIYTLVLKRTSAQNIVIGGAAGAIPPLVGWAAATDSLSFGAWALFAIIFLWTPSHFWALALLIREDYAAAGVPMLPVVAGERTTVTNIWWYSIAPVAGSIVPFATGTFGVIWLVAALLLGGRL
ncbi:MAG: protoheme IX farnesyltransferase, partial [Thermoleophilia bacterium]|nr:protoheme IX farnesyltransferase [Thermoleophilia bacterium]